MSHGSLIAAVINLVGRFVDPADFRKRQQVIQSLFSELANRRMLFDGHCGSKREAMLASSAIIRDRLTAARGALRHNDEAAFYIDHALGGVQTFQTFLEYYLGEEIHGNDRNVQHELKQLKYTMGYAIRWISRIYSIPIPKALSEATASSNKP